MSDDLFDRHLEVQIFEFLENHFHLRLGELTLLRRRSRQLDISLLECAYLAGKIQLDEAEACAQALGIEEFSSDSTMRDAACWLGVQKDSDAEIQVPLPNFPPPFSQEDEVGGVKRVAGENELLGQHLTPPPLPPQHDVMPVLPPLPKMMGTPPPLPASKVISKLALPHNENPQQSRKVPPPLPPLSKPAPAPSDSLEELREDELELLLLDD